MRLFFRQGSCPKLQGEQFLLPKNLSKHWYLHRTNDLSLLNAPIGCLHADFAVDALGNFQAVEGAFILDNTWSSEPY